MKHAVWATSPTDPTPTLQAVVNDKESAIEYAARIAAQHTEWEVTVKQYGSHHARSTRKAQPDPDHMPPLTLDQAKRLTKGTILYHRIDRNADGTAVRWRVNGVPKTWARDASRVEVPVKHGMYAYDYVTESTIRGGYLSLDDGLTD